MKIKSRLSVLCVLVICVACVACVIGSAVQVGQQRSVREMNESSAPAVAQVDHIWVKRWADWKRAHPGR